jgi:hypothetical protein
VFGGTDSAPREPKQDPSENVSFNPSKQIHLITWLSSNSLPKRTPLYGFHISSSVNLRLFFRQITVMDWGVKRGDLSRARAHYPG